MANFPTTFSGNLVDNPALTRTSGGALVTKLRIATSRRLHTEGRWTTHDQLFLDVEAWGDLAYNARTSLKSGMPVLVQGTLVTQEWNDRASGERRSKVLVKARSIGVDLAKYAVSARRCSIGGYTAANGVEAQGESLDLQFLDQDLQLNSAASASAQDLVEEDNAEEPAPF